jgi:hypothetical protein
MNFLLNEVISLERVYDSTLDTFVQSYDFEPKDLAKLESALSKE